MSRGREGRGKTPGVPPEVGAGLGLLVPKLCLGMSGGEALLRVRPLRGTRSRASRTCVPKQSLGTRATRRPTVCLLREAHPRPQSPGRLIAECRSVPIMQRNLGQSSGDLGGTGRWGEMFQGPPNVVPSSFIPFPQGKPMLNFLARLRRSRSARAHSAAPRPTARLRLEALEDRTLLSTFFVVPTGSADNVTRFGTLFQALAAPGLGPGSVVQIEPGSSPEAIQNSDLPIVAGLTIQGDPIAPLSSIPSFNLTDALVIGGGQAGFTLNHVNVGLVGSGVVVFDTTAAVLDSSITDFSSTAPAAVNFAGGADALLQSTVTNGGGAGAPDLVDVQFAGANRAERRHVRGRRADRQSAGLPRRRLRRRPGSGPRRRLYRRRRDRDRKPPGGSGPGGPGERGLPGRHLFGPQSQRHRHSPGTGHAGDPNPRQRHQSHGRGRGRRRDLRRHSDRERRSSPAPFSRATRSAPTARGPAWSSPPA